MPVFLADTTVLSNFAQIGRPDLLRRAFPGLTTPQAVREELARGERLGLVPVCDWSWLTTVELTGAEQSRAADLGRRLQAGEAVCIAVTEHRGGLLLTDDGAARRLAKSLGRPAAARERDRIFGLRERQGRVSFRDSHYKLCMPR